VVINNFFLLLFCGVRPRKDKETDPEVEKLANRIKSLRIAKGYNNYENFAFDNEIPRAQYGRYERGEDLRYTSLVKIVKAHGMTLSEFFDEGFE